MRWILRSKIHKATVTDSNADYIGSITIDKELVEKAGFVSGEKVMVVSNTTGMRLETYIMVGEKNSGIICTNGGCSYLIKTGEEIIIMGFELSNKLIKAKIILVDNNNKFIKFL